MSRGLEQGIHLLEAIAEAGPGGISQNDLARRLNTSEATVSRLSATLEALGYVERMALGVRLGKLAAQLWLSYRKGLKIERAAIDVALRATEIAGEANGEGQPDHGSGA
jgi:DNA-binding IclR family transcriptional regulator